MQKRVFRVFFSYLKNTWLGCFLWVHGRAWYPLLPFEWPPELLFPFLPFLSSFFFVSNRPLAAQNQAAHVAIAKTPQRPVRLCSSWYLLLVNFTWQKDIATTSLTSNIGNLDDPFDRLWWFSSKKLQCDVIWLNQGLINVKETLEQWKIQKEKINVGVGDVS